jgi:ABC-type multidrug transport system fused ATPase/permease subunit
LQDFTAESFRKKISIIPQNGNLFNDTIMFNLKYGNPDLSEEEVIEMCKKCQIHEKIMKQKDGYQT